MNKNRVRLRFGIPVIALVLAATAIPVQGQLFASEIDFSLNLSDIVVNVLGYVPIGLVLAGLTTLPAIAVAALISAVAEGCQLFSMYRFASPIDVVCNIAGAGVGVAASRHWQVGRFSLDVSKRVGVLATLVAMTLLAFLSLAKSETTLENWDPGAQLTVGDEPTHDRPWCGEIRELVIVERALDPTVIQQLTRSGNLSMLSDIVFGPVRDLDLETLRGEPLLAAAQGRRFYRRLVGGDAFTVLVRFRTDEMDQTGPARIVTYSRDSSRRNFTLAQEQERLVFRVRTPASGRNGSRPELQTKRALQPGTEFFAAASYDGESSRVFLDGRLIGRIDVGTASNLLLPAFVVAIGSLSAVALISVLRPGSRWRRRLVCLMGGLAGGYLVVLTEGTSVLSLSYMLWIVSLGCFGGGTVDFSLKEYP